MQSEACGIYVSKSKAGHQPCKKFPSLLSVCLVRLASCFFFGHRPNFLFNNWKKLSQFGHDVRKYRPVNTVMASCNNIMGQMTEMSRRKKSQLARISRHQSNWEPLLEWKLFRFPGHLLVAHDAFLCAGRGVTRLYGARGKKRVWRHHVRTWGLSEANVLHWRKYFVTLVGLFGARGIVPLVSPLYARNQSSAASGIQVQKWLSLFDWCLCFTWNLRANSWQGPQIWRSRNADLWLVLTAPEGETPSLKLRISPRDRVFLLAQSLTATSAFRRSRDKMWNHAVLEVYSA